MSKGVIIVSSSHRALRYNKNQSIGIMCDQEEKGSGQGGEKGWEGRKGRR